MQRDYLFLRNMVSNTEGYDKCVLVHEMKWLGKSV